MIRAFQKWAEPKPWRVRLYTVLVMTLLGPLAVLGAVLQTLYRELWPDIVSGYKEAWAVLRTGKFE